MYIMAYTEDGKQKIFIGEDFDKSNAKMKSLGKDVDFTYCTIVTDNEFCHYTKGFIEPMSNIEAIDEGIVIHPFNDEDLVFAPIPKNHKESVQ